MSTRATNIAVRAVLAFSLAIPWLAGAAPVGLVDVQLQRATLSDLVRLTYGDLLKVNYMMSPSVASDARQVAVFSKQQTVSQVKATVDALLLANGVAQTTLGGAPYFVPSEQLTRGKGLEQQPGSSAAQMIQAPPGRAQDLADPTSDKSNPVESEPVAPSVPDVEVYKPLARSPEYLRSALVSFGAAEPGPGDLLLLTGSPERRAAMRKVLELVDRRPATVAMRVALVEFAEGDEATRNLTGVVRLLSDKLQLATAAAVAPSLGAFATLKTASLDAVFTIMEGDSRFSFRSSPYLLVVDGEAARIQVGADVPTRSGAQLAAANGVTVQSFEYRSTGLLLRVAVNVYADSVRARLSQELSTVAQTTTSSIDSPTVNKRAVETVVDTADGEIVVLGGLDEETETASSSGLPGVSWRLNKARTKRNSQLMLLVEFKRV